MEMTITLENGRWLVNGKQYNELTLDEILALDNFFENYKKQI